MTESISSSEIVEALGDPHAYPDHPAHVEMQETHISWVFLTDRYVYKLKKPVQFEFLDFSTAERRRAACEQELQLNRRWAPGVYLRVVPVTHTFGRLRVDGGGTPVDWLVCMRRLPVECNLDHRVRAGQWDGHDAARVAQGLVEMFTGVPPLMMSADDLYRRIVRHVRANAEQLRERFVRNGATVSRLASLQARFLHLRHWQFCDRVCDGRFVDGHGDLRPEHIYLTQPMVVLDCVEFAAEYRQNDIADELAFFAMECDRLGEEPLGRAVWEHYRQTSGDDVDEGLVAFYKSYRALVRAKVAALQDAATNDDAAEVSSLAGRYLELAEQYRAPLGPPALIVVCGVSGTGKSTLADALAADLGCPLLQTDAIRHVLGEAHPDTDYNQAGYSETARDRIYQAMFAAAQDALQQSATVVLDGTFLRRSWRDSVQRLARQQGGETLFVRCTCPAGTARARIQQRQARGDRLSDARPEFPQQQRQQWQPFQPHDVTVCVDSRHGLAEQRETVRLFLERHLLPPPWGHASHDGPTIAVAQGAYRD